VPVNNYRALGVLQVFQEGHGPRRSRFGCNGCMPACILFVYISICHSESLGLSSVGTAALVAALAALANGCRGRRPAPLLHRRFGAYCGLGRGGGGALSGQSRQQRGGGRTRHDSRTKCEKFMNSGVAAASSCMRCSCASLNLAKSP